MAWLLKGLKLFGVGLFTLLTSRTPL